MTPKISIITPCFNAAKYIEQTILSIIEQDYDNLEYIIIDGGSTDGTVEIIQKYEDRLAYWISEPDQGQSDAINKGVKIATGDVFNWVNADDLLFENALKTIGEYFKNDAVNLVCTQIQFLHPDHSVSINPVTNHSGLVHQLLNTRGLNQMGMYWRMDLIKKLNGVNTAFKYAMDLDLWKRYLLTFGNENIISDSAITGAFRLHADSKTGENLEINASFFDRENNAALCQYARIAGDDYLEGIKILYPIIDLSLAAKQPISELPILTIKKWLNELFYVKIQGFFYINEFKSVRKLVRYVDVDFLTDEQRKNLNSYKKWAILKFWK